MNGSFFPARHTNPGGDELGVEKLILILYRLLAFTHTFALLAPEPFSGFPTTEKVDGTLTLRRFYTPKEVIKEINALRRFYTPKEDVYGDKNTRCKRIKMKEEKEIGFIQPEPFSGFPTAEKVDGTLTLRRFYTPKEDVYGDNKCPSEVLRPEGGLKR
jgi:hypothetical protein